MTDWLPGFEQVRGEGSGPWASDNEDAPKIVLHTTEGTSVAGALAAYRTNRSWPHLTVDFATRRRLQHVPLSEAARALRNTATPGQTNREARVYQIEIMGFAGQSHEWGAAQLDWLGAEVVGPLAGATGTPLQTMVDFYGEGCGWTLASPSARQRLSAAEWDTYVGILGHQHVPENSHWDPGALDVARILTAARRGGSPATPTPPTEGTFMAALTDSEQRELLTMTRENNLRLSELQAEVVGTKDAKGRSRMDRIAEIVGKLAGKG